MTKNAIDAAAITGAMAPPMIADQGGEFPLASSMRFRL